MRAHVRSTMFISSVLAYFGASACSGGLLTIGSNRTDDAGSTCWSAGRTYEQGQSVSPPGASVGCTCTASGVQCAQSVGGVDAAQQDATCTQGCPDGGSAPSMLPTTSPSVSPTCVYYGETYAPGTVPSGDGISTCCCLDGLVICLASLGGAPTCVTEGLVGGQAAALPGNATFYTCAARGDDRSVFVPSPQGSGYVCDGYMTAAGDAGR